MELSVLVPIIGFMAITAFGGVFVLAGNNQQKAIHHKAQKLIDSHFNKNHPMQAQVLNLKKKDIDSKLNGSLRALPSIAKLREKLNKTGKDISLRQYFVWMALSGIGGFIFFKLLAGSSLLVSVLIAIFLALMIPHFIVTRWINKRLKKFLTLLPDALELMVRGLKAGLPVAESINVIKTEIGEPVNEVFAEIAQSIKMGVNFEDALMNMAKKLNINEFNFFVISIALQRETGGNLAEILENLASTIRARAMMKLKIKAITSEARMSAYIVGFLPFFVTGALLMISPNYIDPIFNDIRGNIAGLIALAMFGSGMFIMFRMAKFEI